MAGAAGALGIAGAAIPARPARAADTTHNFLGSYEGVPGGPNQWFEQIRIAGVSGLNGFRQYDNGYPTQVSPGIGVLPGGWQSNVATTWPAPPPGYVGPSVFSIYPHPDSLAVIDIGGKPIPQFPAAYDQIRSLMASAPRDSYLSAWHEFGSIDYSKYDFLTAESLSGLHNALNTFAADYPNVTYGPILFSPKTADYNTLVAAFQSCPPGMGFYGVDVYGNNGTSPGLCQLENFIDLATSIPNGSSYPKLMIAETNTPLFESFRFSAVTSDGQFTAVGSSFVAGQQVMLSGSSLPGGFTAGTTYYVINVSGDSFQLSTASDRSAVTVKSNGSGTVSTPYPNAAPRSGGVGTGWFESVCARMHTYGANSIGLLTYWNVTGSLSGAWDPGPITQGAPGGTTVAALNNCIENIF